MKVKADSNSLDQVYETAIDLSDHKDRVIIQVGNTVVDIRAAYRGSKAMISVYPFESGKDYNFSTTDNNQVGVYYREGDSTSV